MQDHRTEDFHILPFPYSRSVKHRRIEYSRQVTFPLRFMPFQPVMARQVYPVFPYIQRESLLPSKKGVRFFPFLIRHFHRKLFLIPSIARKGKISAFISSCPEVCGYTVYIDLHHRPAEDFRFRSRLFFRLNRNTAKIPVIKFLRNGRH